MKAPMSGISVKSGFHLFLPIMLTTTCLFLGIFLPAVRAEDGEVTFSNTRVTPGSGDGDSTFLFTVTAISENVPEEEVRVVLDGTFHPMKEVDPADGNFSDGKDYYYRTQCDAGGVVYYFQSGNSTSTPRTLTVSEAERFEWHYDVAIIMSLFVVPVIYAVLMFRKMERSAARMTESLQKIVEERRKTPRIAKSKKDSKE